MARRGVRLTALVPSTVLLALCGAHCTTASDDEQPICVSVSQDCDPLYTPTYDALFERTLNPTCGQPGSTCHQSGGAGATRGLIFNTPDHAYGVLLDRSRSWPLVKPGDPGCSKIVYKLTSTDSSVMMPPGLPLSAEERCVVIKWIAMGAPR